MGISPAPPWATIFYALHEQQFLPEWTEHVILYKRFIDDVFGVWKLLHQHAQVFGHLVEDVKDVELHIVHADGIQQLRGHGVHQDDFA